MTEPERATSGATPADSAAAKPSVTGALLGNASALVVSRLLVAALGWAGTVLIVRSLSPADWGAFSFVFSLLGVMAFVTELGAGRIALQGVAEGAPGRERFAGAYIMLRLGLGVMAYGGSVLFVYLAGYSTQIVQATALGAVISIIASFSSALDIVFQSSLRLGVVAAANVVGQLVQLSATLIIWMVNPTLLWFIVPAILFDITTALWKLRRISSVMPVVVNVSPRTWRTILVQAAPLTLIGLITALSTATPVLLLSWLVDLEAVGHFNVAAKFAAIALFIPAALSSPLLPVLVNAWPQERDRYVEAIRQSLLLLSVAGAFVSVAFIPIAPEVIGLLYGQEYVDTGLTARLLVGSACVSFVVYPAIALMIARMNSTLHVLSTAVALVILLASGLVLIPAMSYEGAAISVILKDVALLAILLVALVRRQHMSDLRIGQHLRTVGCALLGITTGLLLHGAIPWPIVGILSLLILVAALHVTRATGPGGLAALVARVRRRAQAYPT